MGFTSPSKEGIRVDLRPQYPRRKSQRTRLWMFAHVCQPPPGARDSLPLGSWLAFVPIAASLATVRLRFLCRSSGTTAVSNDAYLLICSMREEGDPLRIKASKSSRR